mgnify:CR=1 FL=1
MPKIPAAEQQAEVSPASVSTAPGDVQMLQAANEAFAKQLTEAQSRNNELESELARIKASLELMKPPAGTPPMRTENEQTADAVSSRRGKGWWESDKENHYVEVSRISPRGPTYRSPVEEYKDMGYRVVDCQDGVSSSGMCLMAIPAAEFERREAQAHREIQEMMGAGVEIPNKTRDELEKKSAIRLADLVAELPVTNEPAAPVVAGQTVEVAVPVT